MTFDITSEEIDNLHINTLVSIQENSWVLEISHLVCVGESSDSPGCVCRDHDRISEASRRP